MNPAELRLEAARIEAAAQRADSWAQWKKEMSKAKELRRQASKMDGGLQVKRRSKPLPTLTCIVCGLRVQVRPENRTDDWETLRNGQGMCPDHKGLTVGNLDRLASEARAFDDPMWRRYAHAAGRLRGLSMLSDGGNGRVYNDLLAAVPKYKENGEW